MRSMRSPIVLVVDVETGNAFEVASPSTRQNRVKGLSDTRAEEGNLGYNTEVTVEEQQEAGLMKAQRR